MTFLPGVRATKIASIAAADAARYPNIATMATMFDAN